MEKGIVRTGRVVLKAGPGKPVSVLVRQWSDVEIEYLLFFGESPGRWVSLIESAQSTITWDKPEGGAK